MYQNEEKIVLQKKWALICQLNVVMAHRNYFRRNNLWILKLATYTKIEDHYSGCKLATFQIGKEGHMFIFYFVYTKFYWFVMKICELPIWR